MSVAAIVTRGYGTFARVNSVARAGYSGYVGLNEPPTTGYQYTELALPGGGWDPQSIAYNQTPAVATPDVLITPLLSSGGYVVTVGSDGIASLAASGDTSRQILSQVDIYDVSLLALYGAADFAINDLAPEVTALSGPVNQTRNVAMNRNLALQFLDPESDSLVYSITSGAVPTGTAVSAAGSWTGTPTVNGSGSFALAGTDPYGAAGTLTVSWTIADQFAEPNVVGQDQATAEATLSAALLNFVYDAGQFSSLYAEGVVAAQNPIATTTVSPGDTVTLSLSRGPVPSEILYSVFLDDATPVPATARFVSGAAYAQDTARYVALWPADNKVFYIGAVAHRMDGAMLISIGGTSAVRPDGAALTSRGEVLAAVDVPLFHHNRWPLLSDGTVTMSAVS